MHRFQRFVLCLAGAASMAVAAPIGFTTTNLATNTSDPNLVNPWGLVAGPSTPFWIADNGTGTSVLYTGGGSKLALTVSIPNSSPITGIAFNSGTGFNGDLFLFDAENGGVYGWRNSPPGNTMAETLAPPSSANEYKGLAVTDISGSDYAYLANFMTGNVDVVKGQSVAPNLTGNFVDPSLPSGYAPFNVQVLNGTVYVAYAVVNTSTGDEVDGAGLGLVDKFDLQGNFLGRVTSGGALDAPWGMTIAPAGFGNFGGDLLVGNFGDGTINAFSLSTGNMVGTLTGTNGQPIVIDGLWAMQFGNGTANGGSTNTLFFTAGPDNEAGGLFGSINATPEPGTFAILAVGLLLLSGCMVRAHGPLNIRRAHIRSSE